MSEGSSAARALAVLGLTETRRYLRRSHARMMVVFFGVLYALGSMVLGGMLILARVGSGYSYEVLWGNALGQAPWNYPGFLLVAPWGVVNLPFLATWSMVLVSIGVGLGITIALLIAVRLVRERKGVAAQPATIGSVAGLTPAMIALVTLGACCSTTAAATAGVGLVAQSSGSSLNNLLVNNWYLDVFQITVVFIALLAQEMVLEVYGGLFGLTSPTGATRTDAAPPVRMGARSIAGNALRVVLLVGGVTWALAMVAEWTTVSPYTASGTVWFQWIFQHLLISVLAILVAMFPREVASALTPRSSGTSITALRVALLAGGLSLAAWVPPAIAAGGAPGFLNELFGVLALPAAWGAVAPVYSPGIALWVRWGLQYLLLGLFASAVAVAPAWAFTPILWTLGPGTPPAPGAGQEPSGVDPVPAPRRFDAGAGRSDPPAVVRGIRDP